MSDAPSFQTRAVHAGSLRPRVQGALVTPIFQSSTFEYRGEGYHDVGYIRLSSTPNHRVLGERLAALEGTKAAICTSSGMAAIATTLLSLLGSGDHVLAQDCLYGGTSGLLAKELSRFGIAFSQIDPQDPESWARAMTPRTRLIYVESLSNPLLVAALPGLRRRILVRADRDGRRRGSIPRAARDCRGCRQSRWSRIAGDAAGRRQPRRPDSRGTCPDRNHRHLDPVLGWIGIMGRLDRGSGAGTRIGSVDRLELDPDRLIARSQPVRSRPYLNSPPDRSPTP
jgi:hypothetical protein